MSARIEECRFLDLFRSGADRPTSSATLSNP
jgi:hypothetical protein